MPDFLLEIGCEEIPARMIDAASLDLRQRVHKLLERERLLSTSEISCLDTPRRLAVLAAHISAAQPDVTERVSGPSVSVAFKDGQPTRPRTRLQKKRASRFLNSNASILRKASIFRQRSPKKDVPRRRFSPNSCPEKLPQFTGPKICTGVSPAERFVRPVRWLVALLDSEIIPMEFDGIRAGNESRGHRILANGPVRITCAGTPYLEALQKAKVLSREKREHQIRKTLDAAARTIAGARWREDKELLDTVVNLTEWPTAILGSFDPEFLELPEEILVTVMRDHQKYFAIEDSNGKLLSHFLAVLNTDGDPGGIVRHGHERVLRARFNDARFFWRADQKHPLRERVQWLKNVTFQKDLGSYYDKVLRVQRVASWMCEIIRQNGMAIRPGVVHKAACLSKADLTTELVKEFTELQGIVGGLYARVQRLDPDLPEATRFAIADAIYDHYKPESMEDSVPRTGEGAVLSIADKVDSIAGMFALGLQPTGSKDPFALRRQANGIIKTIAEHKFVIDLGQLFKDAREAYRTSSVEKKFSSSLDFDGNIKHFLRERLEFYLRDVHGFKYDVVNAVLAAGMDDVVDAVARAQAVTQVRPSPDFESISVAFKRMKNILRQAAESGTRIADSLDVSILQEPAEKVLATQVPDTAKVVAQLSGERNYQQALVAVSRLRPAIDSFFDKVMVMVDDERIRSNRLSLLQTLLKEFSTIADFSEIVPEGKESKESSKQ